MTKIKLILLLCFFVSVTVSAQVKIGDNPNTINGASLLELETTNKGFVFPRVALTGLTSPSPLPAGLLTGTVVFNTATGVGSGVGLYYWNGTAWVAVGSGTGTGSGWLTTGNDNATVNSASFFGSKTGTFVPLVFRAQGDTVGYLGLNQSSYAVSFGAGASGANTAFKSVAIGSGAKASAGNESVALGSNAIAGSFHDIAIGANALTANNTANMAIGTGAIATSNNAIAIGTNAEASTNTITLALGVSAKSTGFTSMAIGNGAQSTNNNTTAFGALAQATVLGANAFGNRSTASGQNSLAVGNSSASSGTNAIAVGDDAVASGVDAIAIGNTAQATKQNATVLGFTSIASGAGSIILGSNSSATGDSTIIIGNNITTASSNVLILGGTPKKIGMGTTTPQEKLDVVGNVRFSGALMPNGTAGATGQVLTSAGAGAAPTWQPSGSGGGAWSLTGNSGTTYLNNFIGTTDNISMRFRTNNVLRMTLDSIGNIKAKLGLGGGFLLLNHDTGTAELVKLLIKETGEVNWYLDGQDLFMRDGFFDAFGDGKLYKYDFMHIDGTHGRIGFNILDGYSDGSTGGETNLPLTSSVTLLGSIATKVRLLDGSTNYVIQQNDHILIVDKSDNLNSDMILSPVDSSQGREYIFKRNDNGTGRVIVRPAPGEKLNGIVDGAATLGARNSVLEVVCGPDSWWIISEIDVLQQAQVTTTSISASDKDLIEVNFTGAGQSIDVGLPAAADNEGKLYTIKRNANGAVFSGNVLRIVPASGENVDQSTFASPYIMENDFESVTVRSDSTRWTILNNYGAENAVVAVTTAYTPYKNDKTILADASSASFTVTLPGAATVEKGKTYTVKRTNAGANTVIVDGNGSETMDGIASLRLNQRFDYLQLQSDGTNWMIISERISPSVVVNPALPYTATVYDGTISSNGNGTINLPGTAAVLGGKIFTIKNSSTTGNTLTVDPNGSETVDGLATWPVLQGQFVTIQSDGTNWVVIGQ